MAEAVILDRVQESIEHNDIWKATILSMAQQSWHQEERNAPDDGANDEKELKKLQSIIGQLLDRLEEKEDPDIRERLDRRQRERDAICRRQSVRNDRRAKRKDAPTAGWVNEELLLLSEVLKGDPADAAVALRALIDSVVLEEFEVSGKKRLAFRGVTAAMRIGMSPGAFRFPMDGIVAEKSVSGVGLRTRMPRGPKAKSLEGR